MRAGVYATLCLLTQALTLGAAPPKPLTIQNVALSQYDDGPSLPASSYFVQGETIFFSFQISGYRPTGEDDPRIKLSWRIETKDPDGLLIVEPQTGTIAAGLSSEDKNWMPKVRETIQMPPFAPPGTYHISMLVKDEVANAETRKEAEFQVHGLVVEPSPNLVLRNVHFYRGEEDKAPLGVAAYRPGDTVWLRFGIVGFKLGEQNRFEVGYGITVLRANGDVLFQQPEAAVERDQSYYPRRYVPAALSLNLTKDLRPGQYTVVLSADDKVGGQKAEARQAFTVEQ
jgi:hypothetical protein